MTNPILVALILSAFVSIAGAAPFRVVVVGLVHGHVHGVLSAARDRDGIEIVGVYEPNRALFDRFAERYGLDEGLWYDDLGSMLDETKPEAASVMTSTRGHMEAVEACAPRGVHVLVEKPLAVSVEHAERMRELAERYRVHVLTNYETSWYASVHEAYAMTHSGGDDYTPIRRAVFRHGHRGPAEIGCSDEFLEWLTDPVEDGAGALFDFGCYGADIMTYLMDGQAPTSVTCSVSQLKPDRYPRVDDDATIILTYPETTAVIQASWAWTHDNKEFDLHTEKGSIHAGKWDTLGVRRPDRGMEAVTPTKLERPHDDPWRYLQAVVRGETEPDALSSLETNIIVVRILDAARTSAQTGERVELAGPED